MKQTIKLDFVKDTKNTFVYKTDDISAQIKQVYVQKAAFEPNEVPQVISLTLSTEVAS